ncbi:5'/3'-nucleotidase SurE [Candidatus Micrarchaeota archaeon]|nr:5'/3'-nucleotidase SurE [Candidatus Micrarchaeota archaeon]
MILVTNDDGDSEGLRMLLEVAKKLDNAYALVPNKQRSAVSGALTLHKPIRLEQIEDDIYSLNGTPADCVLFSIYSGEFKKPGMVLSGINWGDNTGLAALIGSGTLGACWQAALEKTPSIAFSMYKKKRGWGEKAGWGDRKKIKSKVKKITNELKPMLMPDKFFSVNFPENPEDARIVFTNHLHRHRYLPHITKREDPNGSPYFWMTGGPESTEKGSDYHEVTMKKNIAITEISLTCFENG